jgi:Domain of unknown function (DUF4112)
MIIWALSTSYFHGRIDRHSLRLLPMSVVAHLQPDQIKRVQRLRQLARLLDEAITIPGTSKKIGLDPIIGLIPGGGDTVGMILSAYIVIEAALLGLPKATLLKMVSNILIDAIVGTVPVIGDLFDVISKANIRNIKLLDAHVENPHFTAKLDKWFVLLIALLLFLTIATFAAIVTVIISLVKGLW